MLIRVEYELITTFAGRTVRSSKLAASRKSFALYGDAVEIVAVDDLVNGVFPEIFKGVFEIRDYSFPLNAALGVDAVIHSASPLPGREATPEAALDVRDFCSKSRHPSNDCRACTGG